MKIPTVEECDAVLKESVDRFYKEESGKIKSAIISSYNLGQDSCRIELPNRPRRFSNILWNMIFMDFVSVDKKWKEILHYDFKNGTFVVSFKD